MSSKITLAAKLVKILDNLGSVPKNGYNKNQNYHYMREVDVLEALKKQLVENKIILLTSSKYVDIKDKPKVDKNDNKTVEFITTVETTHTFVDSESGETHTITSVGQGYDSLDKGASKAITAATKYAITKTFMISDEGADIENDGVSPQPPAIAAPPKTFNRAPVKAAPVVTETVLVKVEEPKEELIKPATVVAPTAPATNNKVFQRRTTLNSNKEPNF